MAVFGQGRPAREDESAARTERREEVAEGGGWIGEKHQPEAGNQKIEGRAFEFLGGSVGEH
jgi:hypothetical protein